MWRKGLESSGVFYTNANPIHRGSVLMTPHLPKAHLQTQMPPSMASGFTTLMGGGHKYSWEIPCNYGAIYLSRLCISWASSLRPHLSAGHLLGWAVRKCPGKVTPFRRVVGPLCIPLVNTVHISFPFFWNFPQPPSNTWNSIYLLLASSFLLFPYRKEANFRATNMVSIYNKIFKFQ